MDQKKKPAAGTGGPRGKNLTSSAASASHSTLKATPSQDKARLRHPAQGVQNIDVCEDREVTSTDRPTEKWDKWEKALEQILESAPDQELADQVSAQIANTIRQQLARSDEAPLELLTSYDILTTELPEPNWAIRKYLPVGLTILAGAPKIGKSWLSLQISKAIASSGMVLGMPVEAGPVLYLALEDTPIRLKARMKKQGWPVQKLPCEFMPMGAFIDQVGNLCNGGGERLARQIKAKGYRLVVIDTLSRSTVGDQSDAGDMTSALGPIHNIANEQNCAILMIDHHRKNGGFNPDAITDILGSTAKSAVADTAWGLYRERGKAGAKLLITGRDINEMELALRMDWSTGCWQVENDSAGHLLNNVQSEILEVVQEIGPASMMDIVKASGRDKGNVYKYLQDMANKNIILKIGDGRGATYQVTQQPLQLATNRLSGCKGCLDLTGQENERER